jgi:hypothetical protein
MEARALEDVHSLGQSSRMQGWAHMGGILLLSPWMSRIPSSKLQI